MEKMLNFYNSVLLIFSCLLSDCTFQGSAAIDVQDQAATNEHDTHLEMFPVRPIDGFATLNDPYYIGAIGTNTRHENIDDYVPGGHLGNDIVAPLGSPVVAPVTGLVVLVRRDPTAENGLGVVIKRGAVNFYGTHFSSVSSSLRVGEVIRAGQQIAKLGNTGVPTGFGHVHFSIFEGDTNPDDPFQGYVDGSIDPFTQLTQALEDNLIAKNFPDLPKEGGVCGPDLLPASTWQAVRETCHAQEPQKCNQQDGYRCVWNATNHAAIAELCVNARWAILSNRALDDASCNACNNARVNGACVPP